MALDSMLSGEEIVNVLVGGGGALQMERGEGDAKPTGSKEDPPVNTAADRYPLKEGVTETDLVKAIESLCLEQVGSSDTVEFLQRISKLEKFRKESLKQKQAARREAWREEVKEERAKYARFKSKMLDSPQEPVTNWKYKVAMCKIDPKWRDELKNERTSFLFNAIFPFLYKYPRLTNTMEDILTCRRVSKEWKQSIDHCLSATMEIYTKCRDKQYLYYYNNFLIEVVPSFYCLEAIQYFNLWSQRMYRGRNPFFSRKLRIGFLQGEWKDNVPYWKEMDNLLQRWGKKIWQAFIVFHTGMNVELMYEYLVKYMKLMPNLREILIHAEDHSKLLQVEMLRDLRSDAYGPLKDQISRNPLPDLAHLRTIFVQRNFPDPLIYAALDKYGLQLESVCFYGCGRDMDPGEFAIGRKLPSLKFFCVTSDDSGRISQLTYDFPSIEEMCMEYFMVRDGTGMESIFKSLNSCGSSLRELRLFAHSYLEEPIINGNVKLELPHLEWLRISVSLANLRNLNFLLPLVSLKMLGLEIMSPTMYAMGKEDVPPYPNEQIIQVRGFLDRLYESNIWNLLPDLKLVTMKIIPEWQDENLDISKRLGVIPNRPICSFYTRDEYQKYCESLN